MLSSVLYGFLTEKGPDNVLPKINSVSALREWLQKLGSNTLRGSTVLVAGTKTISTTRIGTDSTVKVYRQVDGGTVAASYSITRVAGTSFTIQAMNGSGAAQTTDTSTLTWEITEPVG